MFLWDAYIYIYIYIYINVADSEVDHEISSTLAPESFGLLRSLFFVPFLAGPGSPAVVVIRAMTIMQEVSWNRLASNVPPAVCPQFYNCACKKKRKRNDGPLAV